MIVALGRVFHIRINAPLENFPEPRGVRGFAVGAASEMDIEESGNVAEVEDALVAQINGLGEQLFLGNHLLSNRIPGGPKLTPLSKRRNRLGGILFGRIGEEYNGLGDEVQALKRVSCIASFATRATYRSLLWSLTRWYSRRAWPSPKVAISRRASICSFLRYEFSRPGECEPRRLRHL
jgi:hypothetical protein